MKYNASSLLATCLRLGTTSLLVGATLMCTACETSKAERAETGSTPSAVSTMSPEQATRLIERAEKVRDRAFEEPPKITGVSSSDELPAATLPDEVARDRTLLIEQLFGQSTGANADEAINASVPVFSSLAGYDKEAHRVLYVNKGSEAPVREAAIIAALVQALDAQHFDALPAAASWDEQLALQAAQNTTVSFALARHLLDTHHPDADPDLLATRPELAGELPLLADWLTATGTHETFSDKLDAREQAFVLREGWTLAAALYRSSGWSGVELSRLMPPERSADVVRPDEWMSGAPIGEWQWPDLADASQTGTVGAAITSMWLEDVIAPRLARTVYAGYMTDAYRFFDERDDSPASFEWMSLWSSPDAARQVAAAFEKRLRKRFDATKAPSEHYVVFQKQLRVGVIISKAAEEKKRERAQQLLEAPLTLSARDGLPTTFVPSRQDRLAEAMQAATMEKRQWTDPATRLALDLSTLGDEWRVQQPDHGPVRWFASHPSGSLLQLTVELDNPFGPSFSSDAYRERLVNAFQRSLEQAKLEQVAPTDLTPKRGLLVRVTGQVDNAPRILQLWQFERDDLVVSYSLQAPPEVFEEHQKLAESILDAADTLDAPEPADGDKTDASTGTIEYKVED